MTLLSIIIPTFNSAGTIKQCIESVIGQTFSDLEVICVDGMSTDATSEIVKELASRYHFIKLISEKDKGVYDAMNKGIKMAKGEWLYFLGSDDSLFNNKVLADMKGFLESGKFDIIYGNVNSPVYGENYDGEFDRSKILAKNIAHQAIFYKKGIFKKIGFYNLKYPMLADWDLNLRWMINKKIRRKYVDLTIAYYSPGGISETIRDKTFYKDFQNLLYKYGYKKRNFKAQILHLIKHLRK